MGTQRWNAWWIWLMNQNFPAKLYQFFPGHQRTMSCWDILIEVYVFPVLFVKCCFQLVYWLAMHSSTIAWKISWTEEPGRPQSMGSQRVRHDWETSLLLSLVAVLGIICLVFHKQFIIEDSLPLPPYFPIPQYQLLWMKMGLWHGWVVHFSFFHDLIHSTLLYSIHF